MITSAKFNLFGVVGLVDGGGGLAGGILSVKDVIDCLLLGGFL